MNRRPALRSRCIAVPSTSRRSRRTTPEPTSACWSTITWPVPSASAASWRSARTFRCTIMPVFEFQYVLQGTGLALDSKGSEIPIAPGGAVLSPAGPSGAHGFRNTGAVPLEILFLYPSREGKPPGRTAFEGISTAPDGPLSVYRPPDKLAPQPPDYPGTHVGLLVDHEVAGTECFGGIVSDRGRDPLHYHPVFEFQYVLSGTGVAIDSRGVEVAIAPGGAVLSPAGPSGAHGFRNTGATPLKILFLYPSPDGRPPGRTAYEVPVSAA